MDFEFDLTASPLTNVVVVAKTEPAQQFLDTFGGVDEANASTFIHAAGRAGFRVRHTQGSIPEGTGLIEWHDAWDNPVKRAD